MATSCRQGSIQDHIKMNPKTNPSSDAFRNAEEPPKFFPKSTRMIKTRCQNSPETKSGGGVGRLLEQIEASWWRLGASWRRPGSVLERFGVILGRLGTVWGGLGAVLGCGYGSPLGGPGHLCASLERLQHGFRIKLGHAIQDVI